MCRMDWRRNSPEVNRPVGMLLQSITLARGTGKNELKYEKLPEGENDEIKCQLTGRMNLMFASW